MFDGLREILLFWGDYVVAEIAKIAPWFEATFRPWLDTLLAWLASFMP